MSVLMSRLFPIMASNRGQKKRLPKKISVGLEYFTVATSNKGYEGYREEIRAPPADGVEGKIIRPADPVLGGLKVNYFMHGGRKYEVGTPNPSNIFGIMCMLIFSLGSYLRSKNVVLVTDSAYGCLDGMIYILLCGIHWVTSFRLSQRRGFLGIKEIEKAMTEIKRREKEKKKRKKRKERKNNLNVIILKK